MVFSGIRMNNEAMEAYETFKSPNSSISFLIFKFTDDFGKIIVANQGEKHHNETRAIQDRNTEKSYHEFVQALSVMKESAYGVCHLHNKTIFVSWLPEGCSAKQKMFLASSQEGVVNSMGSYISKRLRACSIAELEMEDILLFLNKGNVGR
eukprot:Awhi_evm1s2531